MSKIPKLFHRKIHRKQLINSTIAGNKPIQVKRTGSLPNKTATLPIFETGPRLLETNNLRGRYRIELLLEVRNFGEFPYAKVARANNRTGPLLLRPPVNAARELRRRSFGLKTVRRDGLHKRRQY